MAGQSVGSGIARSQWENFLGNCGEWRGSFTSLNAAAEVTGSTPSILSLTPEENDTLVRFHLRRFAAEGFDVDGFEGEPTREVRTDYRTLGRQVVFFDSGSFSKGSLQVAPRTPFGAEFGFIVGDRRFRLVQLFDEEGRFDGHVLIREFRAGSNAQERPPLQIDHLCGTWTGAAATISADWPVPEVSAAEVTVERTPSPGGDQLTIRTSLSSGVDTLSARVDADSITVEGSMPGRLQLLADAGYSVVPLQVSHRQPFSVEAGWMPAPDRLERLIRRYDASGAWHSSTQIIVTASASGHHSG